MSLIPSKSDMEELESLLDEVDEYLDDRADADVQGDPPKYVPNKAMTLLSRLRELRGDVT